MNRKDIDSKIFDKYISYQFEQVDNISDRNKSNVLKYLQRRYYCISKELDPLLRKKEKDVKILDIGCGYGKFTYYCKKKSFKNYLGVDISKEEIDLTKNIFPEYRFKNVDIFDFLKTNKEKFDIIYMAHVLEHFNLEKQIELLKLIKVNLSKGGKFINIMPNADAYFGACGSRYIDITHKLIHTQSSFTSILKLVGFKKIKHMNSHIGNNLLKHVAHRFVIFIFHYLVKLLGYSKKKIYTNSMITLCTKD